MIDDPKTKTLPELDSIPQHRWATRLVYALLRHLHNQAAYKALGLNEFRYVDGGLLPATLEGDGSFKINAEALPFHALRIDDGATEDSWGSRANSADGSVRDVIDLVGAVGTRAQSDSPGCDEVEEIMRVLESSALDPEKRRELQELSGGDTTFTILGGPQARREGPAGRPTQWAWGYRLRLTGPFRQIIA